MKWKKFLAGILTAMMLIQPLQAFAIDTTDQVNAPTYTTSSAAEAAEENSVEESVDIDVSVDDTDADIANEASSSSADTDSAASEDMTETDSTEEPDTSATESIVISAFEWTVQSLTLSKKTEAEIVSTFPSALNVTLYDGSSATVSVTWSCNEDYDATEDPRYIFTAVLPEGYELAKDLTEDDLPCIQLTILESSSYMPSTYADASSIFQPISEDQALDAEYGFSFDTRYEDVSDGQGAYTKSSTVNWVYTDVGTEEWINYYNSIYGNVSSEADVALNMGGDLWCAILDNTQDASYWCDGRVWFQWNNVGYYNGTAVDMKVTLIGLEDFTVSGPATVQFVEDQPGTLQISSNENYGTLTHPTFKFEFFAHGTDTPVSVKGHATFFDIDHNQGMAMGENIVAGYYLDTGWLDYERHHTSYLSSGSGNTTLLETKGWFTAFYDGPHFTVTYCTGNYLDGMPWTPPSTVDFTRPGLLYCGDFGSMFGFRGETISFFDTPNITKRVSSESVYSDEKFTYYLEIAVPMESEDYRYDSFAIKDMLPEELYITEPAGISVTDQTNNRDITSWFINSSTDSTVNISASGAGQANTEESFYGITIEVAIPVAVRSDISADHWQALILSENGRLVSNVATIEVSRSGVASGAVQSRESNTVTTTISSKTQVQVVNGGYSWSSNTNDYSALLDVGDYTGYTVRKVPVGDDQTYSFRPKVNHVLKSITVNGEEVDISGYTNSFTYNFSNIYGRENRILVEYARAKGSIELYKTSSNPDVTDGNACYSLDGAVYGIYSNSACTEASLVTTMTTDVDGYAIVSDLPTATYYYVKEITPPKGYQLNESVTRVIITSNGAVATVKVSDDPANDPIGITLTKIQETPNGYLPSLAGAEFTVNYYDGQYNTAAELPDRATRTWVIETKALVTSDQTLYRTALDDDFWVSGDAFYYNADQSSVILPLGTITIQETKAPDGYTLEGGWLNDASGSTVADSNGVILLNVTEDGGLTAVNGGNYYTKKEAFDYGSVSLTKQLSTGEAMRDAEFKLQIWNSGTEAWDDLESGSTDDAGQLVFDNLVYGDYRIIETVTAHGKELLVEPIEFTVDNATQDFHFTVQNGEIISMPHTGGIGTGVYLAAGLALLLLAAMLTAAQKRTSARR